MIGFFEVLFYVALVGLLLGLMKPSWVLYWGKVRTRERVAAWYGMFALACVIGAGILKDRIQNVEKVPAPIRETLQGAEANKNKIAQQTEAGIAELATKTPESREPQNHEQVKASVRRVMVDLTNMDKPGSDAAGFARSMAQSMGKGVGLGDVYGAMKAAKIAANDSFSRLMRYSLPKGLPATVHEKLDGAYAAFRRAAMLRSDIAEAFMEWLDTRKPSLTNTVKEKSDQVTLAMTKAVVSATEAMAAAGFSDEEVKAELATMSGKD